MFSEEAVRLAKPLVEAIKTIAARQEKECSKCDGTGAIWIEKDPRSCNPVYPVDCNNCKGTGKVKRKWEWKPEWNELAYLDGKVVSIRQYWFTLNSKRTKMCRVAGRNEKSITVMKEQLTPLLHWERIEEILEGMGYVVIIDRDVSQSKSKFMCAIRQLTKVMGYNEWMGVGKTRQLAVMRAVIELEKERSKP